MTVMLVEKSNLENLRTDLYPFKFGYTSLDDFKRQLRKRRQRGKRGMDILFEESIDGYNWGFKNKDKEIVIPPIYNYAYGFLNGLAAVQSVGNKKWGFIDILGDFVIPCKYDHLHKFDSYGYTFCLEGLCGIMDSNIKVIIPNKYKFIQIIEPDFFLAQRLDKSYCIVNQECKEKNICSIEQLSHIYNIDTGEYLIKGWNCNGNMGVVTTDNRIIIPFIYDYIEPTYDGHKHNGFKLENYNTHEDEYWLVDFNNKILESGSIPKPIYNGYEEEGSDYNEYNRFNPYEEEPTYNDYNGSFAQDFMRFSDQDISDAFDGDPDAYWNID